METSQPLKEEHLMATSNSEPSDFVALAAEIVSAYVANNHLQVNDLPNFLTSVHGALAKIADGTTVPQTQELTPLTPAVSIRKSISPDHIICLDDGKKFKSLKRHLRALGLTPDQYRAKWGLPADYPMVAANYTATRSALAKKIGFGQKRPKKV
jgi:predicted transcriptional regulator